MGIFRQFPYSNFHEMNMDEILKEVAKLSNEWEQYTARWASGVNTESLITPEMYGAVGDGSTDDAEAFQLILDEFSNKGVTVVLKNTYLIATPLIVKRHSDFNIPITFIGIGKESTMIFNAPFTGASNDYGNLKFINITFKGSTIFQCDRKLIRVFCQSCTFDSVRKIAVATDVCQSMYFIDCIIRDCDYVIDGSNSASRGYDIKISGCLIEHGYRVFYMPDSPSYETVIDNNCIEGLTGSVAEFGVTRTAIISNNYFERNDEYIILHNNNTNNAIIENNSVVEPAEKVLVQLPNSVNYPASVKIINNNVADPTTPFQFTNTLSGGQAYTGLIFTGNNKYGDNERIGRTLSSIEQHAMTPFSVTIDNTTFPTIGEAVPQILAYARDNFYDHSMFIAYWGTVVLTGMVNIDRASSTRRGYVFILNPSYMGYGNYVLSNLGGAYRQVTITTP